MSSRSIASARRRGSAAAATTRATARRGMRCAMPPTTPERYAVVSCHVERPLDDRVWAAFAALQERRPGGLAIAALMRPPDAAAGEHDDETWLRRAHEAASRGPLGHHTHFTSPTHARPTGGDPGERVRREGAWLAERGVSPTLFCGGGWYTDSGVARACADLGYADCTPRTTRPPYLPPDAAWAELDSPARIEVDGSTLCAVPTSHGAGDLARALARPGLPPRVHAYFHDTDLVELAQADAHHRRARAAREAPAGDDARRRRGRRPRGRPARRVERRGARRSYGGLGETGARSPGERRIVVMRRPRSRPYLRIWALPASLPHDDRRHPGDVARSAKPSEGADPRA